MAAGMARGAAARGKRIAFGDGTKIIWSPQAHVIHRGNPNVAPPGSEGARDLEWIEHFSGHRCYGRPDGRRFHFDPEFRAAPGELMLSPDELVFADRLGDAAIIIEPNVKGNLPNKQWPRGRYQDVADQLNDDGYRVIQFDYGAPMLRNVEPFAPKDFRHAAAALARAWLYIGPEGGLHHAAAAVSTRAVVIFGGFNHPRNFGYSFHRNLVRNDEPCGSIAPCAHCREAMAAIPVDEVVAAAREILREPMQ